MKAHCTLHSQSIDYLETAHPYLRTLAAACTRSFIASRSFGGLSADFRRQALCDFGGISVINTLVNGSGDDRDTRASICHK